jgi:hypothetical protein
VSNCQPRIPYPTKLSFNLDEESRTFQNKDKLMTFMSTKSVLQRILKEIIHTEEDKKNNYKQEMSGKNKTQEEN